MSIYFFNTKLNEEVKISSYRKLTNKINLNFSRQNMGAVFVETDEKQEGQN